MNCVDWVHHDSVTTANPKYPVTMVEKIESKKPSNADRVRSMSDEELATYLDKMQGTAYINGFDNEPISLYPNSYCAWLDWLRQEVGT